MFIALVLLPIVVYLKLPSGVSVLNELTNIDPGLINVWGLEELRGLMLLQWLAWSLLG